MVVDNDEMGTASAAGELVVHVVTSLDFGGVESHMETLAGLHSCARYRHAFCAIAHGGHVAESLRRAGAEVTCLGTAARIPSLAATWRLYRFFRETRPAVVHTHGAEANFHGLIAAALAQVPVRVGEEIGIPGHGRLARILFSLAFRCAHKVIGVSQSVTDWLVSNGEVGPRRAVTLLNPVRLSAVGEATPVPPADPFRACFVGRLEPVKNLVELVAAFDRLVEGGADARLWLVGDGSLRPELERMIEQRALGEVVRLHGYHPAPVELLRQCHVCIQPSLSEGFGLALVEAMGCAVPVISTRVGAAPDLIQSGVSGWLVEGFDRTAIQTALEQAYRTPRDQLGDMGRAARTVVGTLFEPVAYLRRLESVYETVRTEAPVR